MSRLLCCLCLVALAGCSKPAPTPIPVVPVVAQPAMVDFAKADYAANVATKDDVNRLSSKLDSLSKLDRSEPVVQKSVQVKTPRKAYGYTGCLVHMGPNCDPCVLFKERVKVYVADHLADLGPQWSFGVGENFHFNFVYHATLDEELPKFEYMKDGVVQHTKIGYAGDYEFNDIVNMHPDVNHEAMRAAARKAKYSSVERSAGVASYSGSRSSGGYGGSGRARVTGMRSDGSYSVAADDNVTMGEYRQVVAQEEYEQQLHNYRQNVMFTQQYRQAQQYQPSFYYTGATYGYSVGSGRGYHCVGGVCYPN